MRIIFIPTGWRRLCSVGSFRGQSSSRRWAPISMSCPAMLCRVAGFYAAGRAAGLVTVSLALKHQLTALGVAPERIAVITNGVDLAMFRPADRASIRTRDRLSGTVLLSVGNLL